ncbi:agamous-like MADS-box protein AGL65 [Canna indica]|uniref:Agamous-like MADS-box protein AGL65 n=1 Tax=Canna indica TaxID=4628 RepID=A0AAQ3QK73_9LILI|nr:agamous-like MADS-box protein AGL65 [Canna indica]
MTTHLWLLHGQLLAVQERLSYWADPVNINNIDHIRAMEQSLMVSLGRIQEQKGNLGKQLISVDCSHQNGMHLPSGLECEHGALPVSLFHNNDCQFPQDMLPHRDIPCSIDTSLQDYNTYFSAGEHTDLHVQEDSLNEFSPNSCLRLEIGGPYPYPSYSQSFLSEMMKPDPENSLQESTIDYQINNFDASSQNWASTSGTCDVTLYDEQSYTQGLVQDMGHFFLTDI